MYTFDCKAFLGLYNCSALVGIAKYPKILLLISSSYKKIVIR